MKTKKMLPLQSLHLRLQLARLAGARQQSRSLQQRQGGEVGLRPLLQR